MEQILMKRLTFTFMPRKSSWHYAGTLLMVVSSQQTNTCSKNENGEL